VIRRYWLPVLAAIAAVGGAVALVVIASDSGEPELTAAPPAGEPVVMETSVTPSRLGFGDRLEAEIRLTIDNTRVDPSTVVSVPVFRPFQRVGPIDVERHDLGDTTVLRFLYPLQCTVRTCVPRASQRELELPIGLVRYTPREGDNVTLPLAFPPVMVVTRLTSEVRRDIGLRPASLAADPALDELPPLRPRGGPSLLGWLLVGASAAILLGLGAWLARRFWPARAAPASLEAGPALPPLPAALELVERTLAGGEPERRVAFDELARRLEESGEPALAGEARRLAWSESGPQRDRAAELAATVRGHVDGNGA
jgi:hypothetical protein